MKYVFITLALAVASLPALADAGKPFAFGAPASAAKADRTVEVILKDIAFEPKSLSVKNGETVRFVLVNQGKLPHEFNLGDKAMHAEHQKEMIAMQGMDHAAMSGMGHGHGGGNTVLVQPGERAELTWTFKGGQTIEFACNVPGHYQAGMVGDLTIQ